MSSEGEELEIKQEEYSQTLQELSDEAAQIKSTVLAFREKLQEQFNKEFDDNLGTPNRSMLYAQCGTNSQAIVLLLNAIVTDLDLISDLSIKYSEDNSMKVGMVL